jgi:hypothetical protein
VRGDVLVGIKTHQLWYYNKKIPLIDYLWKGKRKYENSSAVSRYKQEGKGDECRMGFIVIQPLIW